MQEIKVSRDPLINVSWEVSKRENFFTYDVVTSKYFYRHSQLKKDGTPKKNQKSQKIVIVTCMYEDIAEHIAEAHNAYMHF